MPHSRHARRLIPSFVSVLTIILGPIIGHSAARAESETTTRFGGDLRLRGESFDNITDLADAGDDAYAFTRMRYRLWLEASPRSGVKLYTRLGNEYRWGQTATGFASIRDAESRVSVDNAWAEITMAPLGDAAFRFGRQDIAFGEGFLIFDGTSADGSSSAYFDALRATWKRDTWQLDLVNAKLSDQGFGGTSPDEDLHAIDLRRGAIEAYALHRWQHGEIVSQSTRPWAIPHPRQRTIALGARVAHGAATGVQGAAEGAFEMGRVGGEDRRAFGGYAHGAWIAARDHHPGLELGALYLSGDDRSTARVEAWDDFYAEWPKWSELLIYTLYDGTTRIYDPARPAPDDAGAWTNLATGWVEGRIEPTAGRSLALRATWVRAAEPTGPGGGRERGKLLAARFDCTAFANIAAQLQGEFFRPGDFYLPDANDAWYARAQLTTSF